MVRQFCAIMVIGLALAACETAGEGPVTLSRTTASSFDAYKQVDFPHKAFAISGDGQVYAYNWCTHTACSGNLANSAVYRCDQRRRKDETSDRPCKVLAVGNTVVWDGKVTFSDTVAAYRLNVAEGAKHRGPISSIGAIIYVPGNHPDYELPPDDDSVPMYVRSMQSGGWDAFKVVTNNTQLRGALSDERAADGVSRHIADLRGAGYKRVVIAAQSFGSWVSLVGGADPETWADANIAAVPGCCGPRVWKGKVNERFRRNRTELRRLLRDLETPTMIIFFAGDEFDPGGRGEMATAAFDRNGLTHRVIDKPLGFSGHSAAWTVQFDSVFGECVADFAAGNALSGACDRPDLGEANHAWLSLSLTGIQDINKFSSKLATESDLRAAIGNTIVGYRANVGPVAYYLRSKTETVARFQRGEGYAQEVVVPSRIDDDRLCLEECYTVYKLTPAYLAAVDEQGDIAFQGAILNGNPKNIGIAGAGDGVFPKTAGNYRLNIAAGPRLQGPEATVGAIIYLQSRGPDVRVESDETTVPTYVRSMYAGGWDAFKVVTNGVQVANDHRPELAVEAVVQHIAKLRETGYKRVVVAAQSSGAWLSLMGGADPERWADANIAATPDCCLSGGSLGDEPNQTAFNRVLRDLKTPTMIINFTSDETGAYPDRSEAMTTALEASDANHLVIDKPLGFTGQDAAWTEQFASAYGACISDFAAGNIRGNACSEPDLAQANYATLSGSLRWIKDLEQFSPTLVTESDLRANIGNTIIGYRSDGDRAAYYLRSETETVAQLRHGYNPVRVIAVPSRIDGGALCLDQCYTIYRWSENYIAAVDESGNIAFQGTILEGNPRHIGALSPSS